MYRYENSWDRVINVPSGRKGVKDRQVLLEHLHTDGRSNEYLHILNTVLNQKSDFSTGTMIIFPEGIDPNIPYIEKVHFYIGEYTHSNHVRFSSQSTAICLPESELEYALMPLTEKVYKGYALIINLYKHRGKKCRRLYLSYF